MMHSLRSTIWLLVFMARTMTATAQEAEENGIVHMQVQRLNDSYIDVYHNKPTKDSMPIMIFCQGSGYDSNTEGFLGVLQLFEDEVVGLAIEKQGVLLGDAGDRLTQEYRDHNTVHNRLYDYLRVLAYLRSNIEWCNGEVYLVGGSEGGLLAGMLACYYPNVKGVSIFSFGGGLNFGEAWPISSGLQVKAEGGTEGEINRRVQEVKDSLQMIRGEATFSATYSGSDNTYAWWNSIIDLRLENCLLDLEIPIYLAQGSLDVMAPPISAKRLHESFMKEGKTNLLYKEHEGYDHGFKDEAGKSLLVQVIMEGIEWILR